MELAGYGTADAVLAQSTARKTDAKTFLKANMVQAGVFEVGSAVNGCAGAGARSRD